MKSALALLLVASLAVSVFGQVPTGSSGAARLSPAIIAQLAARGGGGGLNNLLALSAITGQMGKYHTYIYMFIH